MTINCKGNLIDLTVPKVMGILNVTPDSFYDGGKHKDEKAILKAVEKMLKDGATFIDIGAYSSRPGADEVNENEELKRLIPVIALLVKHFTDINISVDTFRSKVAEEGINAGAALINDISAGKLDPQMLKTIARLRVPYIMMHMRGNPKNMQEFTAYKNVVQEVLLYFSERVESARKLGIHDIIIDPGFGFAKKIEQNYELLRKLNLFQTLNLPVLAGLSRKSMIYKVLKSDADHALNGTTALNMIALSQGANILRVHDVKEAIECVTLFKNLN